MTDIACDIVLLPNDELAVKAIHVSKQLAPQGALFTLKQGEIFPHMSLYMFQLNETNVEKVANELKRIAAQTSKFALKATKYSLGQGRAVGYIDPEYEVNDSLRSVQKLVIDAINPLRDGMRESDKAKLLDASGEAKENLQKYGYPAIGSLFRPHITLTRLQSHQPEALRLLPNISHFDGEFTAIGLFEMGPNGTCVRQIAVFELS